MSKGRIIFFVLLFSCVFIAAAFSFISPNSSKLEDAEKSSVLEMMWEDDFKGEVIDSTKWSYDLGDGCPKLCGWGNNELQSYTKANAFTENGTLIIEARKEKTDSRDYTSSRLISKFKGDWKYGRVEARMKLPSGRGTWPAFWMLSTDWNYGGWPESGEIDIMEHVGYAPDSLFGTVHTEKYNHLLGTQVGEGIRVENMESDWHTYAIEWQEDHIDFYCDDQLYFTFNNDGSGQKAWPFDQRFHIITNLAVGGNWGGKHGVDDTIWPKRLEIDYVRVYKLVQ
ncbi:MAG: beta-glucanase (GH16 family) [Limisphaerales bacterium]|jgi:beta-glucanase (GH16 family)